MKTIDTLIEDIDTLLLEGFGDEVPHDLCDEYGRQFAELLKTRLIRSERKGFLRMSNLGKPCERQLYYDVNNTQEAEPLRPEVYAKFLYGDMIELLMLFLAEASGHKVEGTQDTQEINGVKGHRDAVIDGVIVDVKSASSFSFKKFQEGRLHEDDPFGYITQLQSYLYSSQDDPIVTDKERAAFFVMDKTLGHMCLDFHYRDLWTDYPKMVEDKKAMVASSEPPERGFEDIPDGTSGNMKLGISCSYCSFKYKCWPEARTFLYSSGPRILTKVVREPSYRGVAIPEVVREQD